MEAEPRLVSLAGGRSGAGGPSAHTALADLLASDAECYSWTGDGGDKDSHGAASPVPPDYEAYAAGGAWLWLSVCIWVSEAVCVHACVLS